MGFRKVILGLGETGQRGGTASFRRAFLESSLTKGGLSDTSTARPFIQEALDKSGAVPFATFEDALGRMNDASLNRTLTKMAKTHNDSFQKVIREMHNTDQAALRTFYAQSDDVVQKQMASAFDGGPAFFREGGSKQAVEDIAAKQIKNSADGGKAWFKEKVWPNVTFGNLWKGSVVGVGVLGVGISAAIVWGILGVISAITGLSLPELFGEFFRFIVDPSGVLCASEEGCWELTDTGKVFFGLIALVGIAGAVKFVKLLKTETSEA